MNDNEDKPICKVMKCPVCGKVATLIAKMGEKRHVKNGGLLFIGEEMDDKTTEVFDPNVDYFKCPNDHDFYISEYMDVIKKTVSGSIDGGE